MSSKTKVQIAAFIFLAGFFVGLWLFFVPPVHEMEQNDFKVTILGKDYSPRGENWVPLASISTLAIDAVLASEDNKFRHHSGVDFHSILNSIRLNLNQRSFVSGASTITQQVVKLTFLGQEKTIMRKIREALGALVLEQYLTKDMILTWYLNIVPFGPGIHGVKQAAQHFFGTDPEFLNLVQSVQLAMVLPRPSDWSLEIVSQRLSEKSKLRFLRILNLMYNEGMITSDQRKVAIKIGDFGRSITEEER